MDFEEYIGKPCRSKMAYEFLPKKKVLVDLSRAAEEALGVSEIEMQSKVLLMVRMGQAMVSLFPSGKILVRGEREEEKARETAEKLVRALKESIK